MYLSCCYEPIDILRHDDCEVIICLNMCRTVSLLYDNHGVVINIIKNSAFAKKVMPRNVYRLGTHTHDDT